MEAEPLKNLADINALHRVLTRWGNVREAECLIIGCNFALRISDLLSITVEQSQQDTITLNEQKTGKFKSFPINTPAKKAIGRLLYWYRSQGIKPDYLFQGTGNRAKKLIQPISSRHLNNKLKEAAESIGLDISISSHSMRKSFGYHAYMKGTDIRYLQALFNHKTEFQTLTYIGVTRKTVQDVYLNSFIDVSEPREKTL
tara:strand:- start:818 stop:1417 length:600 start_codon:yes stop_codon:yes gene_type:complete